MNINSSLSSTSLAPLSKLSGTTKASGNGKTPAELLKEVQDLQDHVHDVPFPYSQAVDVTSDLINDGWFYLSPQGQTAVNQIRSLIKGPNPEKNADQIYAYLNVIIADLKNASGYTPASSSPVNEKLFSQFPQKL